MADSRVSPTKATRFITKMRRRPTRSVRSPNTTAPTAEPKNVMALSKPV
jgi:hypothetical protein